MNIGERIGDYEIVEILGSGGMGQVYKVRNTLSERTEAMKVLLPNLESDPDLGDRFLREIKVQAALDHPNIAKFHTAMRVGNQLLMFMEFVDGVSLAKQMEQGPIAPDQAAAIAAQVLDALSYAHARGVVHRDIKPANIMLTTGGVVKLMDFGIARMQSDKRLTQTGAAVGSLFYMSPEQIRGAEPDPRSDLYSLGVTLYEVVTGRRPFGGNSDYQIMSAHLQDSPRPPIEIVPGVSADLSEIILTSIAKDPAARFQSAAAFHAALASVFPGVPAAIQITAPQAMPPPLPVQPAPPVQAMPPVPPPVFAGPPPVPPPTPVLMAAPPAPPPVPRPQPILTQPPFPVQQPVPPPVMAAKSNRTLYMAVGSVATLALLIAAGIEGPKLMHGGSSAASGSVSGTETSAPAANGTAAPGTADPGAGAAPAAAADPVPSPLPAVSASPANGQPPSGWTPVGQSPVAASSQSGSSQSGSSQTTTSQSTSPHPAVPQSVSAPPIAVSPMPINGAPAAQTFQQSTAPQGQSQAQSSGQPAGQPAGQPVASASPAQNREAAQLRQQYNELTIRANAAASGLQSFQQQQSRQGLGIRADIREAKTRLDYQLQEASTAIQSGDAESARQSMRYAQSAIDTIDKFLGR